MGAELPEGKYALVSVPELEEGANTGNKPSGWDLRMLTSIKNACKQYPHFILLVLEGAGILSSLHVLHMRGYCCLNRRE